ncbi:MAG: hypothetical protein JXR83_15740, partial [Deltaproteobacteria bacterium]|nr:hypothetical protein [Deltaproteobacteria bacterium]
MKSLPCALLLSLCSPALFAQEPEAWPQDARAVGAERLPLVEIPEATLRPWVGRLWAATRVDDLTEETRLQSETDEPKNEAIGLALAHNLVCRHTAFLAMPESEITADSPRLMQSARASERAILAQRKDAVALSRDNMPPGDPLLTVVAPPDA